MSQADLYHCNLKLSLVQGGQASPTVPVYQLSLANASADRSSFVHPAPKSHTSLVLAFLQLLLPLQAIVQPSSTPASSFHWVFDLISVKSAASVADVFMLHMKV